MTLKQSDTEPSSPNDENEPELFARRAEEDARDHLVRRYLPLAQKLARRYSHGGQSLDDLNQVASLGLIKAIDRYDPDRGIAFAAYAIPTILGELKRFHRDHGWAVRVPRALQEHALSLKKALPTLSQELGRSPTIPELADRTGLSEEQVIEALDVQDNYSAFSLDAPMNDGRDTSTLADQLATADDQDAIERRADLELHLRQLPERERYILVTRFFHDRTQSEIAAELGISQMHVSRLLAKTLQTLKSVLREADDGSTLQRLAG